MFEPIVLLNDGSLDVLVVFLIQEVVLFLLFLEQLDLVVDLSDLLLQLPLLLPVALMGAL